MLIYPKKKNKNKGERGHRVWERREEERNKK